MVDRVECAFGSMSACMALREPGRVSPDGADPTIKNN
jgi:hypothetical protein